MNNDLLMTIRQIMDQTELPQAIFIEAIEAAGHPFWLGVQWHPEFLYPKDILQKRLFGAFIKAARHYANS